MRRRIKDGSAHYHSEFIQLHMIQEKSAHYAAMDSICLELVTELKSVKEDRPLVDSVISYPALEAVGFYPAEKDNCMCSIKKVAV